MTARARIMMVGPDETGSAGQPLLSIITVCLDREDTIGAALDSVARQWAVDLEHLVIDGQSRDGTLDVVARFPHVRIVSEPDRGLYDAMNKGLRLARGRFVLFLNSDDEIAEGIIAAARPYMSAGYDAVCFGTDIVRLTADGGREMIAEIVKPDEIVLSVQSATLGSPLLNAKMIRRRLLVEAGGFDIDFRLASDVDLLFRAASTRPHVAILPTIGHHYLEHAGSLTINAGDSNGRRAAEDCIAIAEKRLRSPQFKKIGRASLRAMRGGKLAMLALRPPADFVDRAAAIRRVLAGIRDVLAYGRYLVLRRRRSPGERLLNQVVSTDPGGPAVAWALEHLLGCRRGGRLVSIGDGDSKSSGENRLELNRSLLEGAFGWRVLALKPNDVTIVAKGHERIDLLAIETAGIAQDVLAHLAGAGVKVTAATIADNISHRDIAAHVRRLGLTKVHETGTCVFYVQPSTVGRANLMRLKIGYLSRPGHMLRYLRTAGRESGSGRPKERTL